MKGKRPASVRLARPRDLGFIRVGAAGPRAASIVYRALALTLSPWQFLAPHIIATIIRYGTAGTRPIRVNQ
ncbi:hypothetical protein Slala05_81500 [Streptomyces lavendulae subsp. lavendulae]|nr:hypothetical protein Slala05_81500 [Streptomyces lavendulae subsp. lavendulae]